MAGQQAAAVAGGGGGGRARVQAEEGAQQQLDVGADALLGVEAERAEEERGALDGLRLPAVLQRNLLHQRRQQTPDLSAHYDLLPETGATCDTGISVAMSSPIRL